MRIRQIRLESSEPAAQAAFWGTKLGLPVAETETGVEVALRESSIRFERGLDARYHFAINIPRGRIDDAAAWLCERHEPLAFHDDPDVEEGAMIVHTDRGVACLYFLDGGGNVVELIANDHLDNDSTEAFGPACLFEIGEIGIATADTASTSRAVQDALCADILWGGRPPSLLTAIGDDHGVVIVAPIGRGWIPTGLPAEPLPTTIVASGPAEGDVTLPEGPYRIETVAELS